MMKTIIITAHPSSKGFTHEIANEYAKLAKSKGFDYEIINLYEDSNNIDFLKFEDVKKDFPIDEKIKKYQEKVENANEIIFIFPTWNSAEPAIIKNFYDRVFTAGFAFKYVNGKAVGLLKGKEVKIVTTCDGPKYLYYLIGNPLKTIWKYTRINFCGMKLKKFVYIDKMRFRDEDNKKLVISNINKILN